MTGTAQQLRPRRLWLTAPLYLLLLAVAVADIWAGAFWADVGGALGLSIAAAAGVVVLLVVVFLVVDARRQWRLYRWRQAGPA